MYFQKKKVCTIMIDLKVKPFYLSDEQIKWVEQTMQNMSLEEKIGQLFCPIGLTEERDELQKEYLGKHVGGMMYRAVKNGSDMAATHRYLQEESKIPLLLAANLESGGTGIAGDGTDYGCQMLVAATEQPERAYELGTVCAKEGTACGCNWAFAPVADIDFNFRNPITNIRTYGSDPERVRKMALEYVKAIQENGMAAAAKHFPGDGVDERDQHIVTSINSLSCEAWDESYGKIYKSLIDAGLLSIMVGQIALPAYEKEFGQGTEIIRPATLSPVILQELLRKKLGFNGVISTDATQMIGFCSAMPRELAVPTAIESGCDIFLFNRSLEEDFEFMLKGYEKGILSNKRLNEAVKRILGLKQALKLSEKKKNGVLIQKCEDEVIGCETHRKMAADCADRGITLVKEEEEILPLDPQKYPKIYLHILTNDNRELLEQQYVSLFEKEGFCVKLYEEDPPEGFAAEKVSEFKKKYDLVVYVVDMENKSNYVTNRLAWNTMHGSNSQPWFVKEVPTIMISTANPYHLLDAPMIPVYINTYCNTEFTRKALIDKLCGRSDFKGKSPVDAFCGQGR